MRRPVLSLTFLALLAACGTPQERCIARETRDLRAVDRRIAEAEGNLARGYALVEVTVYDTYWATCYERHDPPAEGQPAPPPTPRLCLRERERIETRAQRIDPAAERQRLVGLQAQRRALADSAARAVEVCRSLPDA
jgi:hypothetical protein